MQNYTMVNADSIPVRALSVNYSIEIIRLLCCRSIGKSRLQGLSMTDPDISPDGQMSEDHELIRNRTDLGNRKLATASKMVNERVKASSPLYRRRILSISLGAFMIFVTVILLYGILIN